jgi:hypothetical protein
MNREVPPYLVRRIRQEPPLRCIIEGSTPIIAFGDPWTSHAATLGLNPGRVAFLDKDGRMLDGDHRRHPTLASLGIARLSGAKVSHVRRIVDDCATYFHRIQDIRRLRWFRELQPLLEAVGVSYAGGTACHLDLVQWATDPVWGELSAADKALLLERDVPFLMELLREGSIRILLLNGTSVVRQARKSLDISLKEHASLNDGDYQPCRLFTGWLFGRIRVIGWSTNIQSSFGVTKERRQALAQRIREQVTATKFGEAGALG